MGSDSVSVVIPTWNRSELLQGLLEKLKTQTLAPAEIVVVDNGSEDDSAEAARRMGARVVRMESNAGFAAAVNRGIEASSGKWIAILNNDVELRPDWLEKMVQGLGDNWFACGKLLDAEDRGRLDGAFDELARSGCAFRAGHGAPDGPLWNQPRAIRFASLTAALFRKEIFARVGMLDERFESYLEDVDFGIRCAVAGLGGVYVPGAIASHVGSATLGRWNRETVRRLARNQVFLVAKHYPRGWMRRYGWRVAVGQGLWGLIAWRHSCLLAWLRGKREGARRYRELRSGGQNANFEEILRESDGAVRELYRLAGGSRYWRLYFSLTGK